jgi:hypothetical protein
MTTYSPPNKLRPYTLRRIVPTWDNRGSGMRDLKHAARVVRLRGSVSVADCLDVLMFEPSIFRSEGALR